VAENQGSAPRAPDERLAELAQMVVREPNSIPRRLDLAMALLEIGRRDEAIALFRDIALGYAEGGQLVQAMAVCRGILEIDPAHEETMEMLAALLEQRHAHNMTRPHEEPVDHRFDDEDDDARDETVSEHKQDEEDPTPTEQQPSGWSGAPRVATPLDGERLVTLDDLPTLEAKDEEERTNPGLAPEGIVTEELPVVDPVADALAHSARAGEAVSALPAFPLFSDLPAAAFVELVREMHLVEHPADEVLLREGTPGDAFYLIIEGTVRVKKNGVEVALLGAGSFFGEFAVLSDQRRHATVEAVSKVRLLEVTRPLIDKLVQDHPGVARILRAFYGDRLLATLLETSPFFAGLNPEERADVAARFRPRRFGRGTTIIEEGASGGGLYLILVGEVEVVRNDAAGFVELGRLGEGSYFGEMSLLKGDNASATVRATRFCETVQLPPRDFYEIVSRHPVLWEQLREEAQRRELSNVAILSGEARSDQSGNVYLV
jgi:CRP-like cAMP-binding protein